jgi:hypothetical protein
LYIVDLVTHSAHLRTAEHYYRAEWL